MMRVLRAAVLGYCMGVRRAVDMAYHEARSLEAEPETGAPRKVYTMGPLIHNPQVLEDLRRRGVEVLDEAALPDNLESAVILIRAHGITPQLEAALAVRGARLVDATCPKVKASQMKARRLSQEGYRVFLAGERRHGELIGIQGYAPGCVVVASREEAEAAAAGLFAQWERVGILPGKVALIGQTTISIEEFQAIGAGIRKYFPQAELINTICDATRERQEALKQLCAQADALLVIGGQESANTRRLRAIAEAQGKPVWLVESLSDIPPELGAYRVVGLSAGASTPDQVIDEIEAALEELSTIFMQRTQSNYDLN